MKKILISFFSLMLAGQAWAQEFTIGTLKYTVTDATKHEVSVGKISDDNQPSGNIEIPSTVTSEGVTYTVTSIDDWAFGYCEGLTSLTVPNSVTTIGYSAFSQCKNLTITILNTATDIESLAFADVLNLFYSGQAEGCPWGAKFLNGVFGENGFVYHINDNTILVGYNGDETDVIIPDNVTAIGDNAFCDNHDIKSVTIPNSVTSIGNYAFSMCIELKTINIPSSVKSIGREAFRSCEITSITIPEGVTEISDNTFYSCQHLTSITIPNTVKRIGSYAFESCSSLTSIEIPNSVTNIGFGAFSGCNISTITVPNSVTSIGEAAFIRMRNVIYTGSATGSPWGAEYVNAVFDGNSFVFADSAKTSLIGYVGEGGDVAIPSTATSIGDNAFRNRYGNKLTSVTIPNSVTSIGNYAFCGCEYLTSVNLPNSITSIGSEAFSGCALTSVVIPELVDSIGKGTFCNCQDLESVIIPNSVKKIGNEAFWGCCSLTSITIPDSVTIINESVFEGCANLASVTFGKSVKEIGHAAFSECGLKSITFPSSIETIGEDAFSFCRNLKSIYLPNTIKSIGDQAFGICNFDTLICNTEAIFEVYHNTPSAKVIILGDDITNIVTHAFENCENLKTVILSNSVKSIGESAFLGCTNLTKAEFASVASVCGMKFENAYANPLYYTKHLYIDGAEVTDLVIPDSVTSITENAFINCSSLKSVKLPESVKTIGYNAFMGCEGLTKAEFASVGSLCGMKFDNDKANPLYYAKHLYINGAEVTDLVIPETVASIGENAFVNGSSLKSVKISASVKTVGNDAFLNCEGLTKAEFASIESLCGMKFENDKANPLYYAKHLYINGAEVVDLVLPASLTSVGNYTFVNCSSLKTVKIPESVKAVGNDAFFNCSGLTKAEFASIESLCGMQFGTTYANPLYRAKHLYINGAEVADLTIPNSVKNINFAAFYGCDGLKSVTIPNSVTSIDDWAFASCVGIKTVTIPSSVTTIGYGAFADCTATIYCEAQNELADWNRKWNGNNYQGEVIFNSKGPKSNVTESTSPGTAVAESAASAVNIYAYGRTIVVENATDDICVYNAMGALVNREVARNVSTINVNNTGVYIVKTGNMAKRVIVK